MKKKSTNNITTPLTNNMLLGSSSLWLGAYLFLLCLLVPSSHGSDYGGCGGTVSVAAELSKLSKTKVDFTVVKVKLVSRDGVLKYSTECAPTGHYFVPAYDKGSFFLDIEGPAGWNFEPSRVPVTISEDSPCGDHINFKFSGFSLKGKVSGAGSSSKEGPKGVTLTLFADGAQIGTAVSDDSGSYAFHNVLPRDYEISASHPRWQVSPAKIKTTMEWNNFEVSTPFVVSGYSVSGSVLSGDEPVPDVELYLYSETINNAGCTPAPATAPTGKSKGKLLCVTKSNSKGEFNFASVPPGDYTVVPIYSSAHTTFDVAPAVAALRVGNNDAAVEAPFRVVGFGVSGKVVAGGKGIEGAKVLVNGAEKAVTGKDGTYRLEQFKAGTYTFTATKPSYVFAELKNEKVSASNPRVSDIHVAEVSVCGTLSIAHPPPNVKVGLRDVQVKGEGSTKYKQQTLQADKDGKYCVSLPAGTYAIVPVVSSTEEKSGLNFSPPQATVEVSATPLNDINFSQLRVTVSGRVVCLSTPCDKAVSVTLNPTSTSSSASPITTGLGLTDNQFTVRDVLPGSYRVSVNIPNDVWCWEAQTKDISVTRDTPNIEFVQTGFVLPVTTTHNVELRVRGKDAKGEGETHTVRAGTTSKICLKQPGTYAVTPKSCFKFGAESFSFDTASPRTLELQATHMLVKGTVTSEKVPSMEVAVSDQSGSVLGKVPGTLQGDNTYAYEFWALPGATLKFTPSPKSTTLLPYPPTREYVVPETSTTCPPPVPAFEVKAGRFLKGKVTPGIAGVHISVKGTSGEELAHVLTNADGTYSVGPLYEGDHTVSAHKEDFHFQRDETGLIFKAAKLGRLRVVAVDAAGTAISGVLLSLSGEGYHNNTAIPADSGALVFTDLFPGSYFLRAHLKEYSFQPAHASITVVEGQEASHKFTVTRVAFSCFGSVKGLNSIPERGVVVLAQPKNSDSASVEEAQTDSTGNFRLRGLVPTVSYNIFVKNSISSTPNSLRNTNSGDLAIPESLDITVAKEDLHNVEFIVIRKPVYFDILGSVNASAEHLPTLTANLYDSRSETPIKSIPLGLTRTFLFTDIPLKSDTDYTVRLITSLSARSYQITISPEITVNPKQVTGSRTGCLQFNFEATLKHDVTEVPVSGLSSFIILLVLPVVAFRYRETLMPIAKQLYHKYQALQARRTGVALPRQPSSSKLKKPTKESSQNQFDFLPPGLSNFSPKPKPKTKTK